MKFGVKLKNEAVLVFNRMRSYLLFVDEIETEEGLQNFVHIEVNDQECAQT